MTKTLDHYIRHERAQPLSVARLKTYVKRKGLKFIDYDDIKPDDSIDKILGPGGAVCILWSDARGSIGHFTLCAKRDKHLLWFDPTGLAIHRLAEITDNPFVLQRKLEKERHVVYNRVRYQKIRKDTQSCGRHCVCRFNMLALSDEEYRGVMTHRKLSSDDIATLLTLPDDLSHWSKTLKSEK